MRHLLATCTVAALLSVLATAANAASVNDTLGISTPNEAYVGGDPNSNTYDGREIIGDYDVFAIHGADIGRSGDALQVVIYTNYAGQQGTSGALGTQYGALFIGTDATNVQLGANDTDTFAADPDRFQYAFSMDYSAGPGDASGAGTLYSLAGNGSDVDQSSVNSGIFRTDQAWKPNSNATTTSITGSWTVEDGNNAPGKNSSTAENTANSNQDQTGLVQGTGYISFVIDDFFATGNPGASADFLIFSWAMSCANDIILGAILNPGQLNPVPLPPGLLLLLSGLLGVGWLGRARARQQAS